MNLRSKRRELNLKISVWDEFDKLADATIPNEELDLMLEEEFQEYTGSASK